MKVVLFWLFHWWREVLRPPKQLLKLDTGLNTVVGYCGVILFVVLADLSLFSVVNAEVKYPRMSASVKHVGIGIHRGTWINDEVGEILFANDNGTIRNISKQIKKTAFGSENAPSFIEGSCKTAQLSAQIEISAREYADDPKGTQGKLEELVTALWDEGLAVHLLLSLHYDINDKDSGKFCSPPSTCKTPQGFFLSKVKKFLEVTKTDTGTKTEEKFQYGTYVPYAPCTDEEAKNEECPYDVIFKNFHVPVINDLREHKFLGKIAVIYIYNEFDFATSSHDKDGNKISITDDQKTALTETVSRTFDIAYQSANGDVPIGTKFSTIKDNENSAWKTFDYLGFDYTHERLHNFLKKDVVLGYDCYTKSEELDQQCQEDKQIFLNTISDSDKINYHNGRIEIAEYGRFFDDKTPLERTETFMTNLVKSWSDSSGFNFFAFNSNDMYGITVLPEKKAENNTYSFPFKKYEYFVGNDIFTFDGKKELSHLKKQMNVLAPTVQVFPNFSQHTMGQGQISFDTNVSLDSCPNFRLDDWKVFVDNKPIDNAIWFQHSPNNPPQGSIDPRRYTFNLYTAMGISSDNFLQPVKLEISVNGQEIYTGCFPFKDVCARRWYAKPVIKLWKEGVIRGNSPTTFDAYSVATRAEFITVVVRVITKDSNPYLIADKSFNDIEPSGELWQAVELAKSKGWISGCGDSKFCPDAPITNAEAAKILTLAFKDVHEYYKDPCEKSKIPTFKDVQLKDWYSAYACAAKQANVINGFAGNEFRYQLPMTRATMAKAICVAAYRESECIEAGDKNLPMVLAVTPRKATMGQSITLSVDGFNLPAPLKMSLPGCDNLTITNLPLNPLNNQQFTCTPSKAGNLSGQVKDAMGTVLHEFPLNVATAATQGTPVPNTTTPTNPPDTTTPTTEPGGAAENPWNELKLFWDSFTNSYVSSCTFKDVVQTAWYAESVNKLCGAGILVGYWEGTERVFVKLDPGLSSDARSDVLKNSSVRANVAETLKVFLLGVDYQNISLEMKSNTGEWYDLFINEATTRGLNLYGLSHNSTVTRKQAMTWLAKLFYGYTGSDPIGRLQNEGLVTTDPTAVRADALLNRYELAYLAYRTMLKTGKDKEINFGLRGEPAFKPQPPLGDEIVAKAVASVGEQYPYTDGKYTYCARFVRMMFDKQAIWGDAKSMCNHYGSMMQKSQSPPAGAVLCYAPNASNYNYGHVAIAVGDGTEVGATSLTNGVTKRNSVYGSAYQGWIDATTFSNNYPQ